MVPVAEESMSEQQSIAALVDDIRPLIVAARDRGEHPRYVALGEASYAAVSACKHADRLRGVPVMILGMEIVRADDARTTPRVF